MSERRSIFQRIIRGSKKARVEKTSVTIKKELKKLKNYYIKVKDLKGIRVFLNWNFLKKVNIRFLKRNTESIEVLKRDIKDY